MRIALLLLGALCLVPSPALRADPQYPKMGPDIFDTHADASAQISDALARAAREHKRVIVDFGANWCIWCRRLHATFEKDPAVASALGRDFIVVMVDVNRALAADARGGHLPPHCTVLTQAQSLSAVGCRHTRKAL